MTSELYLEQLVFSNYLVVNRTFLKSFGLTTGIYLSELVSRKRYCRENNLLVQIFEGGSKEWFYAERDSITHNTTLSEYQQRTSCKELVTQGLLSLEYKKSSLDRKAYYKLHSEEILKKIAL